jgi:hypothetical protein
VSTKITFKQAMGQGPSPVYVKESVAEVATLINKAIENKHPFVALTDANTDKEISVRAGNVQKFEQE